MDKNTAIDVVALIEKIQKEMDVIDLKTASSAQLSGLVEDFKTLETAMSETDNVIITTLGGLLEVGGKELQDAYEAAQLREGLVSSPTTQSPQPTLFEIRQIFTKLQTRVKKVLVKGGGSFQDIQDVVDMANTLNDYAQVNSSEQLSKIIDNYLKSVKIEGVQEIVRKNQSQSVHVSDDMAFELINNFKNMVIIAEKKGDGLHHSEMQNVIAEYKKVKHVLDNGTFDSPENKQAMEEMLDGITLEDLEDMALQVVELEASKHSDPDRLVEIEEMIEEYSTKIEGLSSTKFTTERLNEVEKVVNLGNGLEEYAYAHPSRIGNLIKDVLAKSNFEGLKKAFEHKPDRKFTNGKFDLFEEGFVAKCQEYFEDLAVNYSRKNKKYLQEAAQVMKGLPEDLKGLKAESAEEKAFIDNLPGQTTLLAKIIERELKQKEKATLKKSVQKGPSVAKKSTKDMAKGSAKKVEPVKISKKRAKV